MDDTNNTAPHPHPACRPWQGEHIYRKCPCGETAHDADYQLGTRTATSPGLYLYRCRNCRRIAAPQGVRRMTPKRWSKAWESLGMTIAVRTPDGGFR